MSSTPSWNCSGVLRICVCSSCQPLRTFAPNHADRDRRLVHVRTTLDNLDGVSEIRIGSPRVDPATEEHDLR